MKIKKRLVLAAFIISLGLGVQFWAACQWSANFDSDEAIHGLMALHTLQGQPPTYMYGSRYLGSAEALLAAFFLRALGHAVLSLRVSSIILFGLLLVINYFYFKHTWGSRTALLGLLVLAFPSWGILTLTHRPIYAFDMLLITGTGILILSQLQFSPKVLDYVRLAAIGILVGLGLWSHQMMVVYLLAIGLAYWLQSPEWKSLNESLQNFFRNTVNVSLREIMPVIVMGLAGLSVLAFFSAGCAPQASYAIAQRWTRVFLLGLGISLSIAFLWASRRRKLLFISALLLGAGFLIGNVPQWRAWMFFGAPPSSAILPSCPIDSFSRGRLIGEQVIPTMWGIRGSVLHIPSSSLPVMGLSIFAILVMVCALLAFVWKYRTTLWKLVSLFPTSRDEMNPQIVFLLFWIPIMLMLFGSNTKDLWSIRYLLVSWQASSIILALFLSGLFRRKTKTLSSLVLLTWILQIVTVGYVHLYQEWHNSRTYEVHAVAALEMLLEEYDIQGGYADYWMAYTLDFLTEERLAIAPYNGIDRYPRYSEMVEALPRQVYLLPIDAVPADDSEMDDLMAYLRRGRRAVGPTFPRSLDHLANQYVIQRQRVANWDVWLISSHPMD